MCEGVGAEQGPERCSDPGRVESQLSAQWFKRVGPEPGQTGGRQSDATKADQGATGVLVFARWDESHRGSSEQGRGYIDDEARHKASTSGALGYR